MYLISCFGFSLIFLYKFASWLIVVGFPVPMLNVSPSMSLLFNASIIAFIASVTYVKSLVCFPSPTITNGSFLIVASANFEQTLLYTLVIRGP